jgi:outer membrane protein OmpA-like peptidoglycan-associated protein
MAAPHMSEKPADGVDRPDAGGSSHEDEKALQELRTLLLSEEQHEIVALRERLESPQQRARDVSAVVAEAIQLRRAQGGGQELSAALTPSVEEAVRESVRKDSHVLVEALFPVMGPAIRRSVAEVFRSTVESFNKVLESTFSIRGLQWRIEAIRAGRPYAEVALLRSLVYRVEQVFLIHLKTSLVLQHVVGPSLVTQDADMVSSMLSAIRDFVRDSFSSQPNASAGDSLDSLQMGDVQVWIEQGPQAIIAAVIRGQAPQELRVALKEKMEEVHRRYANELERFEGDPAPFGAFRSELAACLTASYRDDKPAKSHPYLYVCAIVLAVLLGGWFGYAEFQNYKWARFVDGLRQKPGIVVTSFGKSGGRYQIQGLRDPLAVDPTTLVGQARLDPRKAEFRWGAYYALDDSLVQERAAALLKPPGGVTLSVQDGTLRVSGDGTSEWQKSMRERAPLIAGIRAVDDGDLTNENSLSRLKAALESKIILFDLAAAEINPQQQASVTDASRTIQKLLQAAAQLGQSAAIELVGHADSSGPESTNVLLSQERATNVLHSLERSGVASKSLRASGVGMSSPLRAETDEQNRQYNRSVTFRVVGMESSQSR